jgi:hypothetical protein
MKPHTQFARQGVVLVPEVLTARECAVIAGETASVESPAQHISGAGTRNLLAQAWCRQLAAKLRTHTALAALLPADAVAVQCTYFEKSPQRNWLVPPHQDLNIPVAARVDDAALRGWSEKEGALYVQPPAQVLAQLVAVRLHVDDCNEEDGPLKVVPGSHLHGPLPARDAAALRRAGSEVACLAARGSALAMRPLLLHASSKSTGSGRRRVLHFLFGPAALPCGLRWANVNSCL